MKDQERALQIRSPKELPKFSNHVFSHGNMTFSNDSSGHTFLPKSRNFNSKSKNNKKKKFQKKTLRMSVWTWLLQLWQLRRKLPIFWKDHQKVTHNPKKKLSLKISWQNFSLSIQFFGRIESSFRNVAHQFLPNYWKNYVLKIRKGLWVSQEIFCPSFFFWTCNLIFWQHWRIFTAKNFKCFWSIPVVFEKSTIFEIKSAKSTSDRQTHSSYKPTELPGQKSKKVTQNPREKLPQQSFQQKVFFLKLFLGRHRR